MTKTIAKRTRNAGTMTEAGFWCWLRSGIRRMFIYWKPGNIALENARRPYKGSNKRQKYEYQCAKCKKWFKRTEVEKDHIIPCGNLTNFKSAAIFIERLAVEVSGFQILCKEKCHLEKTLKERKE